MTLRPRRSVSLLLGLAACVGLALWIDRGVGWQAILRPWTLVAAPVVLLALVTQVGSYLLRAARLAQMEAEIGWRRLLPCLRLVLIHNLSNLLLPMRSGEASFPLLMRAWFGSDPVRAGGLLLWLRLCDLHVLAGVSLLAAAALPQAREHWLGGIWAMALSAAVLLPALVVGLHTPLAGLLDGREDRLSRLLHRLLEGLPRTQGYVLLSLAWTWAAWLLKLAGLAWLLSALSGRPLALGALGAIGGDLSTVLPVHAPGGFGTFEAGAIALMALFSPDASALLPAVFNLHLFLLGVAVGAGVLALLAGPQPTRCA